MKKWIIFAAMISTAASGQIVSNSESRKDTAITIYNFSNDFKDASVIVLRQKNRKIETIWCGDAYKGQMNDSNAVIKYYKKVIKTENGVSLCYNMDKVNIDKRVEKEDEKVRYIYTTAGISNSTSDNAIG